jgi:hypothetical protein
MRDGIVATILVGVTGAPAPIMTNAQPLPAAYTVTLHCDHAVPLRPAGVPAIYSWARRLVASSQGNSDAPDWALPVWETEQEYRDALSGDYLRIDFASLDTISTIGGVVYVTAIVKGLDPLGPDWRSRYPDHFDDSLFTINEKGTVVAHAKYSGLDIFALNRTIERALPNPDACKHAEGLFVQDSQLPHLLQDFLRQNNLQN